MTAGRKTIGTKKEWCTPPKYVELITKMLGTIDLDPCSNSFSIIEAKTKYSLPLDGLKQEWNYDKIYVNPPYGRDPLRKTSIKDWILKINETHEKYGSEILCLIPVATNTSHYKEIIFKKSNGICFLEDTRLKFMIEGEISKKGSPMACAMIYWGNNYDLFQKIFEEFGSCFKIKKI